MEELRSTDVLDKEIRADSVKKAEKILEKANETASALMEGVDQRVKESEESARKASKARVDLFEKNEGASVPLEKQRYLVSYINSSILDAIKNYFENMDPAKKLQVIENMARSCSSIVGDRTVSAVACGGLSVKDAESVVKKAFSAKANKVELSGRPNENSFDYGILVSTEDGKVRCRLTLEEKINEILGQKREQLALALFGGRLPE